MRGIKKAPRELRNTYISKSGKSACVLGCAALGAGFEKGDVCKFLMDNFPEVMDCDLFLTPFGDSLARRNDDGATRQRIAGELILGTYEIR
jgi:hypothetical protein